jgi:hypothetical protein
MENINRGPTVGDFVTILREGSMQDITIASTRVQTSFSPSIKCNVWDCVQSLMQCMGLRAVSLRTVKIFLVQR